MASGFAHFTYTQTATGVQNLQPSDTITFLVKPVVSITGSPTICEGDNSQLSPSIGGTWQSSNSNIASVSNDGFVLGMSGGLANFTFYPR